MRQIEQLNAASTGVDTPSSTSSESPKNSKTGSGISERCEIPPSSASNDGRQSGDSSDSYDYTTITKMNTPRPIDTTGTKSPKKNHSLPHSCFAVHMVKNLAELQEPASDDEDDDDEDDGERRVWGIKTKSKIDLFKPVTFISSKGFMTYFADTVFPNGLGNAIGFDEESIRAAKTIPGLIFCDSFDSGSVVRRHVIPGVYIQWPAAIAFEWAIRDDRPTIIDRRTTLRYKWPTDSMINEIRRLKCVVVPKGCVPKRGENRDSSVEWEVAFPKAEKYIETKMSHAQMRCFLFLVALHKTFIEPVTAYHGLLIEHIRNHMYWECEANYPNWPENRLGKKLLRVLRMLYVRLGRADMPGYFIREKNVFENVPGRYLRPAQELIHRVTEAPVMYFLVALRNIRYTSGKFYPALDFKRLHSILVSEGIRTANPLLYRLVENDRNEGGRKTRDGGLDAKAEWRKRHQEEIKRKFRMEEREKKKLEENLESQRRASVDSVDLQVSSSTKFDERLTMCPFQWSAEKNFDVYKQRAILMFFMDHFIEMAKKSLKLATSKQSLFYLRHAWYLSKLLEDTDGCYPDAVEYQARIRTEEDAVKRISASEVLAPVTPKRNPSYVLTNGAETTQQVRVNANKTFDSGLQAEVVHRKLKKQYANSRKVVSEIHQTPKSADSNFNDRPKTISFNADVHTFDA